MIRLRASLLLGLLILLVPWQALTAPTPVEAACAADPTHCICSEPMDANDDNMNDAHNPNDRPDSPNGTECWGRTDFNGFGVQLGKTANSEPVSWTPGGFATHQTPGMYLWGLAENMTAGHAKAFLSSDKSACMRYYLMVSKPYDSSGTSGCSGPCDGFCDSNPAICCTTRHKMAEFMFQNCQLIQFQEKGNGGQCYFDGTHHPLQLTFTTTPLDVNGVNYDSSGILFTNPDCDDLPCRIEMCVDSTDLSTGANVVVRARMCSLEKGICDTITSANQGNCGPPIISDFWYGNWDHGGSVGSGDIAFFTVFRYQTTGNWIGPASEVEGGGNPTWNAGNITFSPVSPCIEGNCGTTRSLAATFSGTATGPNNGTTYDCDITTPPGHQPIPGGASAGCTGTTSGQTCTTTAICSYTIPGDHTAELKQNMNGTVATAQGTFTVTPLSWSVKTALSLSPSGCALGSCSTLVALSAEFQGADSGSTLTEYDCNVVGGVFSPDGTITGSGCSGTASSPQTCTSTAICDYHLLPAGTYTAAMRQTVGSHTATTQIGFDITTPGVILQNAEASGSCQGCTSLTIPRTISGTQRASFARCATDLAVSLSGATDAGVAMTNIASIASPTATTNTRATLFGLINPATGAGNLVVSASSSTSIVCDYIAFTGVHQTTAWGAAVTGTGVSASPSVVRTSVNGDVVIDILAWTLNNLAEPPATVGSGQTQQFNDRSQIDLSGGAGSSEPGAGSVSMTWTLGLSRDWAQIAVSVKPADVPPPPPALGSQSSGSISIY